MRRPIAPVLLSFFPAGCADGSSLRRRAARCRQRTESPPPANVPSSICEAMRQSVATSSSGSPASSHASRKRTGVELDVQPLGIAADDLGLEHAAVVGHSAQEGRFQSGQIVGGELGVLLPPPQLASPVDRPREQFLGPIGAKLLAQLVEDEVVDHGPILEGVVKLTAKLFFRHDPDPFARRVRERHRCSLWLVRFTHPTVLNNALFYRPHRLTGRAGGGATFSAAAAPAFSSGVFRRISPASSRCRQRRVGC